MAGFTAPGNIITLVAPVGGVTAGIFALIGGLVVVPITTAAEGYTFAAYVVGVHPGVKASGTTATAGAAAYWDSSTGLIETSDSASNRRIGAFAEDAVSGSTSCSVRLDGKSFGAGDIDMESKADKIVPASPGNLAGLSASGNLEDSGIDPTDVPSDTELASTANGEGASLIGIEDAATRFTGTDVETALTEVPTLTELASVATGEGASLIGVEDAGTYFAGANVEAILAFIGEFLSTKVAQTKTVVIALGAATGSSAADPAWVGADVIGFRPVSGNDQAVKSISVAGDGAVTVETAVVETAEATFEVVAILA